MAPKAPPACTASPGGGSAFAQLHHDGLQRSFGGIQDNRGINAIVAFEHAKDNGFTARTCPGCDWSREVGFIGFKLAWGKESELHMPEPNEHEYAGIQHINRAYGQTASCAALTQVHGK